MILWRGCCVRDRGRGSEVGRAKKEGVRTVLLEIFILNSFLHVFDSQDSR